jgi:hypothetical protein
MGLFIALAIAGVGIAWVLGRANRTPELLKVVVIGLCARLAILTAALLGVEVPGMGGDDVMHHTVAEYDAMFGFESALFNFRTGRHFYTWVLSVVYSLVGPEKLVAISVNLVAGVGLIAIAYHLSFSLWGNRKAAMSTAWLVSLFPNLAIYSVMLGREIMGIVLFTAGALAIVRGVRFNNEMNLLVASGLFFLATLTHSGYVVALLIPVILLARRNRQRERGGAALLARVAVFAGSLALIGYIAISGRGLEKFTTTGADEEASIAEVVAKRQASRDIDNRAAYLTTMQPQSVVDLAWQAPVRMVYFLLTPFPWMISAVVDVFGLALTMGTTGMFCLAWCHRKVIFARVDARCLAGLIVLIVSLFAMGTSNYGTALRHRTKVVPLLAAIIPVFAWRDQRGLPGAFVRRGRLVGKAPVNLRQPVRR